MIARWLPLLVAALSCGPVDHHWTTDDGGTTDGGMPSYPGLEGPIDLKVVAFDTKAVEVTWTNHSTIKVSTNLEVSSTSSTNGFTGAVITEPRNNNFDVSPQTVVIDTLVPDQNYWFRIRLMDATNWTHVVYSNVDMARTPKVNLVPPANLTIYPWNDPSCTAGTGRPVKLSWTKSPSQGDDGYLLEGCSYYIGSTTCQWDSSDGWRQYKSILNKPIEMMFCGKKNYRVKFRIRVGVLGAAFNPQQPWNASAQSDPSNVVEYTFPP